MTPDKHKRPLPSSTSMALPESPETFLQWKAALEQVNIMYVRAQWKHCAAHCNHLLSHAKIEPHPLHATYLHFYSAVSSEAIARLAHALSPDKIHLLEQAKASYQAAASTLPPADVGQEYPEPSDTDTRSTSSTPSDERSVSWTSRPPSSSASSRHKQPDPVTSSPFSNLDFSQTTTKLRPSPLRIRKVSSFKAELADSGDDGDDNEPSISPCTRPQTPPSQIQHPAQSPSTTSSASAWLQARYNDSLAAFADVITNHISAVDAQLEKTRAVQSARYFTKRLASYGEDEESRAANLRFRIARLKAGGWRMERFEPERYRELCARALAEL